MKTNEKNEVREEVESKQMDANHLLRRILDGRTLHIATRTHSWIITRESLIQREKRGRPTLRNGHHSEKGFFVSRGRQWDYVHPTGSRVYFV